MKSEQVIRQLQAVLPLYTDSFSDYVNASSLTRSGTTVTCTTATAHGLTTGDYVYIKGAYSPNLITSITRIGTVATAVCASGHDLTEGWQTTVNITGANQTAYNGVKSLIDVLSATSFTFTVTGSPATPATGTTYLQEEKDGEYNGRHAVTVTGDNSFTYQLTTTPLSPAQGTIKVLKGLRISGAISIDRVAQVYSQMPAINLWLFVVPGDVTGSKDRRIQDDATYRSQAGQDYRQELNAAFSIIVLAPTTASIAGRLQRDNMEDEKIALFKALLGVKFDSGFSGGEQYYMTYVSDTVAGYVGAYYMHQFNFEIAYDIASDDIVSPDSSTAWRTFDMNWLRQNDTYVARTFTGKLDF